MKSTFLTQTRKYSTKYNETLLTCMWYMHSLGNSLGLRTYWSSKKSKILADLRTGLLIVIDLAIGKKKNRSGRILFSIVYTHSHPPHSC